MNTHTSSTTSSSTSPHLSVSDEHCDQLSISPLLVLRDSKQCHYFPTLWHFSLSSLWLQKKKTSMTSRCILPYPWSHMKSTSCIRGKCGFREQIVGHILQHCERKTNPFCTIKCNGHMVLATIFYSPIGTWWVIWLLAGRLYFPKTFSRVLISDSVNIETGLFFHSFFAMEWTFDHLVGSKPC